MKLPLVVDTINGRVYDNERAWVASWTHDDHDEFYKDATGALNLGHELFAAGGYTGEWSENLKQMAADAAMWRGAKSVKSIMCNAEFKGRAPFANSHLVAIIDTHTATAVAAALQGDTGALTLHNTPRSNAPLPYLGPLPYPGPLPTPERAYVSGREITEQKAKALAELATPMVAAQCNGTNCNATVKESSAAHSPECIAEHERVYSQNVPTPTIDKLEQALIAAKDSNNSTQENTSRDSILWHRCETTDDRIHDASAACGTLREELYDAAEFKDQVLQVLMPFGIGPAADSVTIVEQLQRMSDDSRTLRDTSVTFESNDTVKLIISSIEQEIKNIKSSEPETIRAVKRISNKLSMLRGRNV